MYSDVLTNGTVVVYKVVYILGLLQLLSALDSISLIFGSPLSYLTVGLGHPSLQLSLGLLLLLKLLSEQITVMTGCLNSVFLAYKCFIRNISMELENPPCASLIFYHITMGISSNTSTKSIEYHSTRT